MFSLSRYDENYDIRDRARFLRPFIFPADNKSTVLSRNAKKIFLAPKPAPLLESKYKGREQYQLGSLSHYLNIKANGYLDLPTFPKEAPDSIVRGDNSVNETTNHSEEVNSSHRSSKNAKTLNTNDGKFYSESENESSKEDDSSDSSEDSSEETSGPENESDNNESEEESDDNESATGDSEGSAESSSDDSDSSEEASGSGDEESSSDARSEPKVKEENHKPQKVNNERQNSKAATESALPPTKKAERSNLELLLELDDIAPSGPIMTPSLGGFLTPGTTAQQPLVSSNRFELVGPTYICVEKRELLNRTNCHGLEIHYRFLRAPHLFSAKMVSLELTFRNESSHKDIENIHVSDCRSLPQGVSLNEFVPIAKLSPGQSAQGILGIDFNDSTQSISFEISSSAGKACVSVKSALGELIRAIRITEKIFDEEQSKLRGMNEYMSTIETKDDLKIVQKKIFETANVALVSRRDNDDGKETIRFAGQTMASQSLVLITVESSAAGQLSITVNCEKMVVGSMLLNEIKNFIKC